MAGYLRVAHESIPGNETNTPTLATKKVFVPLLEYEPDPGFGHLFRDDELVNTDEPRPALPETADPTWRLSTRNYPDVLGYLLSCALGLPTTTAGDGIIVDPDSGTVPATAYRHVWTSPFGPSGAYPKTAQHDIAYSDPEAVFFKAKGAMISEFGIETPETGGGILACNGPALYLDKQSNPSLTPAYEAETLPPFMRPHLTIPTWLSNGGPIRDFSLAISIPNEPRHSAGSGSKWPDALYKGDAPITVTGSIPKELLDETDFDALKAATGFAAKAKWLSTQNIAATGYKYTFWAEFSNAQYTEGTPDVLANTRRRGMSLSFRATRSASASVTLTLVNATASYA